ncbi:MAG: DUF2069 domain-containing protein [Thiotrichales bacterium]
MIATRARVAHAVTLAAFFGLFFLLLGWTIGWRPAEGLPRSLVLLALIGPMLLPLRGLLYGKAYTHAWSSFLALWYFVLGVSDAALPETRGVGYGAIGLSLLWFTSALLYVRWQART